MALWRGQAIALSYISHGAKVAVNHLGGEADKPHHDSLIEDAKKILPEGQSADDWITLVAGDVTLPETGANLVTQAVSRWGRLDIFVSNAGVCKFAEFLE